MTVNLQALVSAALEQPPEQRVAFLDQMCGRDTDLRLEIDALLRRLDPTVTVVPPDGLSDASADEDGAVRADDEETLAGSLVGPYRIVRELGRGGMAVVYLAARAEGGFEQEVALKLMKRGLDTDDVIRRFRQERQILARLDHPGIARLLDGGIAPDGRPFFAMELVRGEPIDRFCDAHGLNIDDRIDLCAEVGRAVQYAHRALVIHRDLKPSNILITADRQVKLLDFGIARLLQPSGTADPGPLTRMMKRAMTPEYASPEQVRGEPMTTAADVYQLGLLLFELLTGRRAQVLAGLGSAEAERVVCEQDPPRPSSVARVTRAVAVPAPRLLAGWLRRSPEVSRELDDIVLTALRKEPDRRYGSAQQLVEDLERYRRGLPLSVRGSSSLYRAGKFLRRHAASVAAGLTVAAVLAAVIAFYSMRLAAERDTAQREAQTATNVAAFVVGLFELNDPFKANRADATAREILQRGADQVHTELAGQPDVQSRMMRLIADIYRRVGLYDQAVPLLQRASEIQRGTFGARSVELAQTLYLHGVALDSMSRYREARPLLEKALDILTEHFGQQHPEVAKAVSALGALHRHVGSFDESRRLYERALAIQESAAGPHHRNVAVTLNNLGLVHQSLGNHGESRPFFERALAIHERNHGPDHALVAAPLMNLADAHRFEKNYAAARPLMERAVAVSEKAFGPNHPDLATAVNSLANLLNDTGKYAEAVPLYERAIRIYEQALGAEHPHVAYPLRNLGNLHRATGAYQEALRFYERALAIRVRALGRVHPSVAQSLESVGAVKLLLGDISGAEPVLREALEVARKTYPAGHATIGEASAGLGWCLASSGRFAEAEPLLTDGYRILVDKRGTPHASTRTARERLKVMYERWGRGDQAARYRAAPIRP